MLAPATPASIAEAGPGEWRLAGCWTGQGISLAAGLDGQLQALAAGVAGAGGPRVIDGSALQAIDSAGVCLLRQWQGPLQDQGGLTLRGWPASAAQLMELAGEKEAPPAASAARRAPLETLGRRAVAGWEQMVALCRFIGESALLLARLLKGALIPRRGPAVGPAGWRWRPMWHAVQVDGFEALPIIGLTAFLLGIVVAYQGADQLRHYGASIFVVDLVGFSILREFAPLITAIIVAGRSGSAYAAQIGTMAVTEEIDALHTLGIEPIELLVLPKIFALLLALPLLTVFADLSGVAGGMLMARLQLDIGYGEFVDRFAQSVDLAAFLLGVGKALVFAVIIVVIGCFQGFRTHGGADSVGRQTTHSVVQAIFLVIVADALFSVVFSLLAL